MSTKKSMKTKVRLVKKDEASQAMRHADTLRLEIQRQTITMFKIIEATARSAGDTLTYEEAARMIHDMSGIMLDVMGGERE